MSGPSYLLVPVLVLALQDVTRAAGCQLVLHGAGLEMSTKCRHNQIDNGVLYSSSRSELLGNELSSFDSDCFGRYVLAQNADVQRLLWFPLVLSGDLECLLLSLCTGGSTIDTQHSLDLRDLLVNRLVRPIASVAPLCR